MSKQSAQDSDVFELILHSLNDTGSRAQATAREEAIPQAWHEEHAEGELAVDVLENDTDLIIVSTMAGAHTEKIEVYVHNDLLTIRGERLSPVDSDSSVSYIHEECFWGSFSRTIVLPVDVKGDLASAEYKSGILKITIPKQAMQAKVPIIIADE